MKRLRVLLVLAGCTVGPEYHRPPAPVPSAYKDWKVATPADAIPRGRWWTMFRDPELDGLVVRLNVNNQTIAQAVEDYVAAASQIRAARSALFPTATLSPSASISRGGFVSQSSTGTTVSTPTPGVSMATGGGGGRRVVYSLPADVSWAPDLFGRVRNTVHQNQYTAQARAADVENVRLLQQSTLAQTFFELRGQDSLIEVLQETVKANEEIVNLTQASYRLGISNEAEVLQAQLTLQNARVQATNAGVARAQFENAIATLIGAPASSFSLPRRPLQASPPAIPHSTPSQLLERRPDIAAAERAMAAANAAIGVGQAAYFPVLTLTGNAGFSSNMLSTLLSWPSRVWALGGTLAETIFDGGLRRANVDIAVANYRSTVAAYRQTVLTAFQQVEDQLAALAILAVVIEEQRVAVEVAEKGFEVERARYATGLDPYVTLMTQQTLLLAARQTLITLEVQRMTASVLLVQALGGGWSTIDLPSPAEVTTVRPGGR
ncbi:MAG: efflux transporter outer membrane subunit [Kofleriaceae bacterium]|nr:efflux transporter outer membrane subunit [Kofleriaceae bacterium]